MTAFGAMLREFSDTSTDHSGTGAMYSTTGSTDTAGVSTMYSLVGQDVLHQQRRHCDQRMSSHSGAARMGATTLCLHGCVLTQKMRNIVSCAEATCLVVLKRHTPAVRLCGSTSYRKPTAGHRPSTCRKAQTSTARVRTSDPAIDKEFVECAFLRLAHGLHIQNNVWACSEPFRIPQPEPKPHNH